MATEPYKNILLSVDGPLAQITVNRPQRLNALNTATLRELVAAAERVAADDSVRVLVLSGAGDRAFIAGADIVEMADKTVMEGLEFAELGHRLCTTLEQMTKPAIAAVNGYALGGGCEVAIACDFVYASDTATIGQPEVNLGIIPGFGGTQRLLRRVPVGMAREIVFTGRSIKANEALRIGLVNAVYPADKLMRRTLAAAHRICEKGPLVVLMPEGTFYKAVSTAKRLMVTGLDLPLDAANELERRSFAALFDTEDQKEGMKAFMEKRAAEFKGR